MTVSSASTGLRQRPPALIKWTGSKRQQAAAIAAHFPNSFRRYFDPFLGGGALLYFAGHPGAVAGDTVKPLIEFWRLVQNSVEQVIADYAEQWERLQDDLPGYFYAVRDRFNERPNALDLSFLMRTCVNGIVRFNAAGQFNNSFHLSRRGMRPQQFAKIARHWHARIQGVHFVCQDYRATVALAERGDFVYFDPPYGRTKQRYQGTFDPSAFWTTLEDLNRRGVRWALSYDGRRGDSDFTQPVPPDLFKRRVLVYSGHSAVERVLHGKLEPVYESLYLNY